MGKTARDGKCRRMHVSPNSDESGSCVKEKLLKKEKIGDLDESVKGNSQSGWLRLHTLTLAHWFEMSSPGFSSS